MSSRSIERASLKSLSKKVVELYREADTDGRVSGISYRTDDLASAIGDLNSKLNSLEIRREKQQKPSIRPQE